MPRARAAVAARYSKYSRNLNLNLNIGAARTPASGMHRIHAVRRQATSDQVRY
eukprot:SAG31_NODE_16656_length_701_cov_1.074751_1_plen_52_part_10